jgi:hypothetical protein
VLEQALLRLLPPATSLPDVPTDPAPELDRAYRASLENAGSTEETNH